MKNLGMTLIVLTLLAGPASGVVVQTILDEDFTGTAGADLETLPGWTKTSTGEILISDEVIDDGQSAQYGRRDAVGDIRYEYEFPNVENHDPDKYFELTLTTRCLDDLVYVSLHGRTRMGSNGFTYSRVAHTENVWDPDSSPEKIQLYSTYPNVDQEAELAGGALVGDTTAYIKLICTPGAWSSPPMANPGSRVLYYSEVSDSGPWTEVYTDTSPNGSGMWRVDYLEINGGYAPTSGGTGGIYNGWETGFLDSIKLELRMAPIAGDVNDDGFVGGHDITAIIQNWGMTEARRMDGDLDGDGSVGGADYTEVQSNWGNGTPPEPPGAVPEPAAFSLLLLGGLALIRRRY